MTFRLTHLITLLIAEFALLASSLDAGPIVTVIESTSSGGFPLFTFQVDPNDLAGGYDTIDLATNPIDGFEEGIFADVSGSFNQVGFPNDSTVVPGGDDSGLLSLGFTPFPLPSGDTSDTIQGGLSSIGSNDISNGLVSVAQIVIADGGTASGSFLFGFADGGVRIAEASGTFGDIAVAAGDFNNDSDVDGDDFLTWQRGFESEFTANDLDDWQLNFGASGARATVAAVPEPSTLLLVLGLGIGMWSKRR